MIRGEAAVRLAPHLGQSTALIANLEPDIQGSLNHR